MQNIDVNLLLPHPNNPRGDLGDISELAESIKAQGVLQNLTVVDNGDITYTVIIGHRRLAAAKLAGIEKVPCTVVVMDKATQASTMLLENMQRIDLTPYEQAQGFQMCLDLGMSTDTLKEKTGFSKTTINHRLKLLKLDQKKFKKGIELGATLQDYIDLEQIEDQDIKNKILDTIGTNEYRYKLNNELNIQSEKKLLQKFIEKLEGVMEQVDVIPSGYEYKSYLYDKSHFKNYAIPSDVGIRKYVFEVLAGRTIRIYKEGVEKNEKKSDEPKKPTQTELNIIEIKEKTVVAYQTRLEFAKGIYQSLATDMKKNLELRYAFALITSSLTTFYQDEDKIFQEVTKLELKEIDFKESSKFDSIALSNRLLFALIYASLETDRDNITVNSWSYGCGYGQYTKHNMEEIKTLYDFLGSYGYQPSEEEIAIMFGTHSLYVKEQKGE